MASNRPKHSPLDPKSSRLSSLADVRTWTSRSIGVPPVPPSADVYSSFTRARSASSRAYSPAT